MWSRTVSRGPVRRSLAVRTGVVALAVAASTGLGMPAAGAAPATTIALDPSYLEFSVHPPENLGALPVASPLPASSFTPIEVGFGGSVTFIFPALMDRYGSSLAASLDMSDGTNAPTRTYNNQTAGGPDSLTVAATGLVDGQVRIHMPADDGVNGPYARLALTNLRPVDPSLTFIDPAQWSLKLTATGPANVDLSPQTVGRSAMPCFDAATCGVAATLTAGAGFDVTLPATSRVATLGIPDLRTSAFSLAPVGGASGGPAVPLVASLSDDGRTASLKVPAGTAPGRWELDVVLGDGTGRVVSDTVVRVDVVAAVNPGLRSETGGGAGSASLPLVALALVGIAGGLGVRSRRRTAAGS
jgi:hypothetical protein